MRGSLRATAMVASFEISITLLVCLLMKRHGGEGGSRSAWNDALCAGWEQTCTFGHGWGAAATKRFSTHGAVGLHKAIFRRDGKVV